MTSTPAFSTTLAPATMSLSDVAGLARVQRPVVTTWRRRKAHTAQPFPAPLDPTDSRPRFDAEQVVDWLEATDLGNNRQVRADAAAFTQLPSPFAAPGGAAHLGALLCLKALTGELLTAMTGPDLLDLADERDPGDHFLYSEVESITALTTTALAAATAHADAFADAHFSPVAALEALERAERIRRGDDEALSPAAATLMGDLAIALLTNDSGETNDTEASFIDVSPGNGDVLLAVRSRLPENIDMLAYTPAARTDPAARATVRRLHSHGIGHRPLSGDAQPGLLARSVVVAHLRGSTGPGPVLEAVDNLLLGLGPDQRAVVLAPAEALVDRLNDRDDTNTRAGILRSDRIRSIVALPAGGLPGRPRQHLALWVLGDAHPDVPSERQWTTTADLRDRTLSDDVTTDLVNDVLAALGNEGTVRSHAFRFSRRVDAHSVRARSGRLVEARPRPLARTTGPAAPQTGPDLALRIGDLAGRLDEATRSLVAPALAVETTHAAGAASGMASGMGRRGSVETIEGLLASGALTQLPGHRIAAEHLTTGGGARVVDASLDLASGVAIDHLTLAATYPRTQFTEPGDVIYVAAGTLRAIVDPDGASLVRFPARVLRVHAGHPGRGGRGVVPELVCRAINAHGRDPAQRSWKTTPVPIVPLDQLAPVARAAGAVDAALEAAQRRLDQLRELKELVLDGAARALLNFTDSFTNGSTENPTEGS
ncbi:hypothetical protein SAMN05216410_1789 [Sanguibacter gelidistatuariae]|uniref:N-6 DNA Methylase n=1 Tax=Sanguibacter gelidistatuariae TaxID=1814289 RepID=A0A1G6L825_9MICO|nr:hypothetical protein [Sanguibacter gelidistatuariae]SDC39430.1 hypothetical protein SAMN05216410_1789 [Sanguibacter gelidistatuariae]